MSVLAVLFGSAEEKAQDSDKLLDLYWNRAELKKEFAGMRRERYRLQDRIKEEQNATVRVQQQLLHLEGLLSHPQWAGNVLVFFQLRALALRCERKLSRFAGQLKKRREHRMRNSRLVSWNEERMRERRAAEGRVATLRETLFGLEERLETERGRQAAMRGLSALFRRRAVRAVLDGLQHEIAAAREQERRLLEGVQRIKSRRPPEDQEPDVPARRSINFMIIAYAQQLYLDIGDDKLAALAREAGDKSVGAVKYGDRGDCEDLLTRIRNCRLAMDGTAHAAAALKQRARLIGDDARFARDAEAVPLGSSVGTLYAIAADGCVTRRKVDLLGDNYWGIARILCR